MQHGAVLPAYVGIGRVTPGLVADSSRVPTVVVRVPQLGDDVHRQAVLVGNLHRTRRGRQRYDGEKKQEEDQ